MSTKEKASVDRQLRIMEETLLAIARRLDRIEQPARSLKELCNVRWTDMTATEKEKWKFATERCVQAFMETVPPTLRRVIRDEP